jgi:hypothetical protein
VDFEQKEYDSLAKTGLVLQRKLTVLRGSAEIRLVVRDAGSTALGSVSIPAKTFFPPSSLPEQ